MTVSLECSVGALVDGWVEIGRRLGGLVTVVLVPDVFLLEDSFREEFEALRGPTSILGFPIFDPLSGVA